MKRLIFIALACAALVGCPTNPTTETSGLRPDAVVFAGKGGYEIALDIAIAYAELPRCAPTVTPICSTQPVVNQVVRARNVARDALQAAETIVRTPGFGKDAIESAQVAAQAALKAFTSITTTLRTQ